MGMEQCKFIEFPIIHDVRGNLSFVESNRHIPFDIRRVYYLYDVPSGANRGGHAHRKLQQLIIAISGSFDVILDDGSRQRRHHLNRSHYGLYIAPMMWREIDNFSSNSVCLVLASDYFDEADYFREYSDFQAAALPHGAG